MLLAFLGFICGWGLSFSSFSGTLKAMLSALLARFFIPVVIIYNMVFYQAGSLSLMLFSFVVAVALFYLFRCMLKDPLSALCVSYVNLAWLGFPLALALFGESVSAAMVALYIGGSLFGNIWAITAVSTKAQPLSTVIKKVALSPPVLALAIALVCRSFGLQHLQQHHGLDLLYSAAKVGMSLTGMCVLGIWLAHTKVATRDLWQSSKIFLIKIPLGLIICGLSYFLMPIAHIERAIGVMFLLFCLPPAANIVALETHYHGTGISAKYIASGTIVSCVVIALYALSLQLYSAF